MTPKEKALELYHKFFKEIPAHIDIDDRMIAKECALIAVDEILKVVSIYNDTQAEVTYWQEVKKELEKL